MSKNGYEQIDTTPDGRTLPAQFAALSDKDKSDILAKIWSEVEDGLNKDELRQIDRLLAAQLAPFYLNPEATEDAIRGGIDKTDVGYHTVFRLLQVFGYVLANGTNSDANNDATPFNQLMSDPAAAWSLGLATIIPMLIGGLIRFRQLKADRERNSIPYLQTRLNKINPQEPVSEDKILEICNDLLDRGKVAPSRAYLQTVPNTKLTDAVIGSNKLADFVYTVSGDTKAEKEGPVKTAARTVFAGVKQAWYFLADSALVFWPIWMVAVMIIGIAATYVFPALPIIVAATFVTSIAIKAGLAYYRRRTQKKMDLIYQDPLVLKKEQAEVAEITRMRHELKSRVHMKREHGFFKSIFGKFLPLKEAKEANPPRVNNVYTAVAARNERVIVLIKNPALKQEEIATPVNQAEPDLETHRQNVVATLKSDIGQRLLGSKAARRGEIAINMVNNAIGYYTLSAFVLWLVGCTLLALAPITAVIGAIGALVLGITLPAVSASFSGLIGGIYSLRAFADTKKAQLEFEKTIYNKLSEEYKPGITKQQAFDELDRKVNQRKRDPLLQQALAAKQQEIREKEKGYENDRRALFKKMDTHNLKVDDLTPEDYKIFIRKLDDDEAFLLNYDLNKIDVYNDRYFRTQEEKPSTWIKIKKGLFQLYKAVNAAQTWIFVTRSLFLFGAALGGICLLFGPAAGFAFIGIAVTMAVVGVAFKLAQLYKQKKAAEKAFFVETFDTRLSYLKKQNKQLQALENYLSNKSPSFTEEGPGPTKEDRDPQLREKVTPVAAREDTLSSLLLSSPVKMEKKEVSEPEIIPPLFPQVEIVTEGLSSVPKYAQQAGTLFNTSMGKGDKHLPDLDLSKPEQRTPTRVMAGAA